MTDDASRPDRLDLRSLDPHLDTAAFDALVHAIVQDAHPGLIVVPRIGRTNLNAIGNRTRVVTLGVAMAAIAAALFVILQGPARETDATINADQLLAEASGLPARLFRMARNGEHPSVLEWLRLYPAILAAQPLTASPRRQP